MSRLTFYQSPLITIFDAGAERKSYRAKGLQYARRKRSKGVRKSPPFINRGPLGSLISRFQFSAAARSRPESTAHPNKREYTVITYRPVPAASYSPYLLLGAFCSPPRWQAQARPPVHRITGVNIILFPRDFTVILFLADGSPAIPSLSCNISERLR